jgi:hypothetical protein
MSFILEISKANGIHHQLSKLEGEWEGTTKVWFEPDKIADESPVKGKMRLVLEGRFILHEYTGSFGGKNLEGMMIIGYHLGLEQYQSAWIDSYHNGSAIMFSEGKRNDPSFSMLGSYAYVTPELEQHWGWRTEFERVSENELIIRAYNISPEGDGALATETVYWRKG